ncbi:clavesin-1-like isoform X2 [Tachypleus tridentatus]|uniref:clavesin-1-like isoform X2 n=1 Tax=Tachypleus tridentatus TaxID=6853 RepID=UPI003FD28D4F
MMEAMEAEHNLLERKEKEALESLQEELREWTVSQPYFINPRIDQSFLRRFLHYRNYSIHQAKEVLERYLKVRTNFPHCYQGLDIEDPSLFDLLSNGFVFPLPEKDKDGSTIIFSIAGKLDPKRHSPRDLFRAFTITFETLLEDEENQRKGFTYIFDQTDFSLGHFTFVGLKETQRLLSAGEMVVHWSVESLQLHFPATILPKEYGGQTTVQELAGCWVKKLRERREHLLLLDQMIYDESKQLKNKRESSYPIVNFLGRLTWANIF